MLLSVVFWSLFSWGALPWLGTPLPMLASPWGQGSGAREVYGKVTDIKGAPVAGASVALSNDKRTLVITNSEGRFLLKSGDLEPSLRITSAGYYDTTMVVTATNAAFIARLRPVPNYKRQFKRKYKAVKRTYKK